MLTRSYLCLHVCVCMYISPQKYEIDKIWTLTMSKSKATRYLLFCMLPLSLQQSKLVLSSAGLMRPIFY